MFVLEQFLIVDACPGGSGPANNSPFDSGGAPFFEATSEAPFLKKKHQELQNEVSKELENLVFSALN